jgi:hypothetical protein
MDANGVDQHHSPPYTTHEEICKCLWNGNSSALPHYGAFLRRSVLTQVGNYREEFRTAQDLDLFLRLSEVGKLANVPKYLMRYRVHEGSVGAKKAGDQARNAREILRQAYERKGMKLPKHLAKWDNVVVAVNRLRWGWQALDEGRYADARGHAWAVLRRKPFRKFSWQLALHAAIGPWRKSLKSVLRRGRKPAEVVPAASIVSNFPAPSPGMPGEGRGEGLSSTSGKDPHPNPLPAYREREPEALPHKTDFASTRDITTARHG